MRRLIEPPAAGPTDAWDMWDDDPEDGAMRCPACGNAAVWDGGVCSCDYCGYVGDGQEEADA